MPDKNDIRKTLLANGYLPLPVCGKACYARGWSTATIDEAFLREHARKRAWASTGIRCGSVVAIDVDIDDALADEAEKVIRAALGETPFVRYGKGQKRLLMYWNETPDRKRRTALWTRSGQEDRYQVEILGLGCLMVAYGTHPSGVEYRWTGGAEPYTDDVDTLPMVTTAQLAALPDALDKWMEGQGLEKMPGHHGQSGESSHDYCLTDDMVFDVTNPPHGLLSVADIEARITSGEQWECHLTAIRPDSDSGAGRVHRGASGLLSISDFVTGQTYFKADMAGQAVTATLAALPALSPSSAFQVPPAAPQAPPAAPGNNPLQNLLDAFCYVWDGTVRPIDRPTEQYMFRNFSRAHTGRAISRVSGRTKGIIECWIESCQQASHAVLRPDSTERFIPNGESELLNIYTPPTFPDGGSTDVFHAFMAHLIPHDAERSLMLDWLAHKVARPADRMHVMVLVAHGTFGVGRGTLSQICEKLLGEAYCTETSLAHLTGGTSQSQYNDYLADSLLVTIPEAYDTQHHAAMSGGKWHARKAAYEAIKQIADTSARRQLVVRKGVANSSETVYASLLIATNHRDALAIEVGDRRVVVLENGFTPLARAPDNLMARIHAWLRDDANVGALHKELLARHAAGIIYDPFGEPPMTGAKAVMVNAGRSDLDRAWSLFMESLPNTVDVVTPHTWRTFALTAKRDYELDFPPADRLDAALNRVIEQHGRRVFPDKPNWQLRCEGAVVRPWIVRNFAAWSDTTERPEDRAARVKVSLDKQPKPAANVVRLR